MEIAGYLGALFIGIVLGLIGGGGSILAVPILAYLFLIDEKLATAYSLFIVGTTSLIGGLKQHKKGLVDWNIVLLFGIPAIIGVSIVRKFIIPILPDILFSVNDFEFTRRMAMFGLFAILMLLAAITMIRESKKTEQSSEKKSKKYPLIIIEGILVGSVTGFVGAGGGFLIIPALVLLANVEMKVAVATSLIIIAVKSLIGFFIGDVFNLTIDWQFLGIFTGISLIGIFLGTYLSNFIDGK